jgi:hypothetical protein
MYLLLSVAENWSDLKTTFILLCFNPLILFICLGLDAFFMAEKKTKYVLKIALLSAVFFIGMKLISTQEFEADQRWYIRFPRAIKGMEFSFIGDDLRTKFEDPKELYEQRKDLTRGNLLPKLTLSGIDLQGTLKTIKKEITTEDISTVDIWKYIYEK